MQLNSVRVELSDLLSKSSETQLRLDESLQQVQQLRDLNALLKAQKGTHCNIDCVTKILKKGCTFTFTYLFTYMLSRCVIFKKRVSV